MSIELRFVNDTAFAAEVFLRNASSNVVESFGVLTLGHGLAVQSYLVRLIFRCAQVRPSFAGSKRFCFFFKGCV